MQTRMRAALAAATRTARPCRVVVAAAATRTTFLSSSLCCARRACATRAQARPCHRVSTTTTPPTTTNATADTVASTDERADALLRALRSARATHADDAVRVCAYASGVVAIEVRNDGAQATTTTTTTSSSSWLRVAHACVRGGQQRLLLHRLLFALSVSPTSARITDDNDNNDNDDDTHANGDRDDDDNMMAAATAAAAASPVANARSRARHAASQRSRHDAHRVQHALLQCARALLARVRPTASLHYTHETVRRPHQPSGVTTSSSHQLDDEAARVHVVRIHIVQNDSACRATASRQQSSSSSETTIWGKNTHCVHAQAAAMCLGSALFRALYIAFAQLDVHFTYTPPAAAQLQLSQAHSPHHHNSHHHNNNDNAACHVHINDAADETVVSMLDAYRRVLRACCASYAVLVDPLPPERASATTNGDNNNSNNNNSDGARDEDGDATAVVRVRVLRDGAEVLASVSGPQTTLLALLLRAYATAARHVDAVRCDAAQRRIAGDPLLFARSARPSASHTTTTPSSSTTSTAASSSRHTNHDMASTRQMMRRALLQLLLYYYDVPYRAVDMTVSDSAYSTYACRVCVRVPRVYERYSSGRRVDNNNNNNSSNNNNSNDDKDAVLCVELAHAGAYDKRMAKEVACLRAVTRHFRRVYDEQLRDDAAVQALLRSHDARASDAAGGGVPCPPVSVGVSMVLLWVLQRSGRRHHLVSHYVPYHRLARTAAASAHGLQAHASLLSNNNNSNSNDNNSNNDDDADTTSEAALAAAEAAVTWTEQFCLVLWIATLHICAADTSTSSSSGAAALTTPTRAHGKAAAATVSSLHDAIVTRPNGDVVVTAVDVTRARCERKAMAMFLAHHDRALCRDVLHAAVTCGMLHRDGSPCVVTTTAPTANARATFAAADVVATAAADAAADDAADNTTTQAPLRTYDVAALLTSPHRAQLQRVRGGAAGAVSVLSMCRAALHAYARDYDTTRQQRSSAREDKDSSHKDDNNNDDEKAAATSTSMTWLVDEAVRSCVDDAACANDAARPPPRQRDATRVQCVYDATLRLVATDADGGEWATTTLSHARAASRPAALLAAYMAFARHYLDDNKNDNRNNNDNDNNNNDNKASACRRERMGAQSEVAELLRAAEWLLASQPTSLSTAAPLTSLAQHAMSCSGLQTYVYMEHLPHVCTVAVYGVDEGDDDAADTDGSDDTNTAESEHDDNDGSDNEDDTSNNKSKSSSDDHNDGADTVPLIERRHARMGRKNVYCTHTTRNGARRRVYHSDVCERATFAVRCTHARPDKALSQCIHDAFARLTVDTTATTTRRRDIAASSSSSTTATSPATSDEGVVLRFKAASVLGVLCRAVMHDVNTHYASSMRATQRSTMLHDDTHGRTHARDNNDNNNNNNNNNNTAMYKGSVRVQTHASAADASRAVVAVVVALDAHPRDATAGLSCVRLERVEAASVLLALRELCTRIRDELGAGHAAVREAARLAAAATATATPASSAMHMAGLRPSQLLLQQVTQRLATLYGLTMTMRESYSECDRQWQCSIAVALDAQHECVVMTAKSSRKRAAQWQAMHNLLHTHLSYDVAPTTTTTTTTRSATNTNTTRNATAIATTTTTTCADETRQHAYAEEEEQQQQSSSFVLTGEADVDARSVLDATLEDLSA